MLFTKKMAFIFISIFCLNTINIKSNNSDSTENGSIEIEINIPIYEQDNEDQLCDFFDDVENSAPDQIPSSKTLKARSQYVLSALFVKYLQTKEWLTNMYQQTYATAKRALAINLRKLRW